MKDLFLKSQQDFLFGNLSQLDLYEFNCVLDTLENQQMREDQVNRLLNTLNRPDFPRQFDASNSRHFHMLSVPNYHKHCGGAWDCKTSQCN